MALYNVNPGFEDGTWQNQWRLTTSGTDTNRGVAIVSSPVRTGNYALKFWQQDAYRCEIVPNYYVDYQGQQTIPGYFYVGNEYWLGFSVYMENWATNPMQWCTLLQTHGQPYNYDWTCGAGDNGMSIYTAVNAGTQYLKLHADIIADAENAIPSSGAIGDPYWAIPIPDNQWVDFVIHFKYSYTNDGFIQCWYNGSLICDIAGSTVYKLDRCGLPREPEYILKLGNYRDPVDNGNYKVSYLDEVRIGDANSSYAEVSQSAVAFVSGEIGNVDTTSARITFSESLISGNTDGTHTITGSAGAVTTSNPTIVGGVLDVTTSRAIVNGETLTYAYTNSGANPLQGTSGEVQTFGAQTITNNVASQGGSNLVTNGTFDDATGWEVDAGWAITGGQAVANASNSYIYQGGVTTVTDTTYRVTLDVTVTSGSLVARFYNPINVIGVISASGSYSYDVVSTGSDAIQFYGASSFTGTVDNVSVVALTAASTGPIAGGTTIEMFSVADLMGRGPVNASGNVEMFATGNLVAKGLLKAINNTGNIITNGTFDTTSNWVASTGWVITGGQAVATNTSSVLVQYFNITPANCIVSFDVVVTSGSIEVYGNDWGSTYISTSGSKEIEANVGTNIVFLGYSFTGTIDNVVIKRKITGEIDINASALLKGYGRILSSSDIELLLTGNLIGKNKNIGSSDIAVTASASLIGHGLISGDIAIRLQLDDNISGRGLRTGSSGMELIATADLVGKGTPNTRAYITLTSVGTLKGRGQMVASSDIVAIETGSIIAHGLRKASSDITLVASADIGEYEIIRGEILELDSYVTSEIELDSYVTTELNLDSYLQ